MVVEIFAGLQNFGNFRAKSRWQDRRLSLLLVSVLACNMAALHDGPAQIFHSATGLRQICNTENSASSSYLMNIKGGHEYGMVPYPFFDVERDVLLHGRAIPITFKRFSQNDLMGALGFCRAFVSATLLLIMTTTILKPNGHRLTY